MPTIYEYFATYLVRWKVLAEPHRVDGGRHEDDLGFCGGDLGAELLDEEEDKVHGLVALVHLVDEDVRPLEEVPVSHQRL